jgi:hypothetical protein
MGSRVFGLRRGVPRSHQRADAMQLPAVYPRAGSVLEQVRRVSHCTACPNRRRHKRGFG